MRRSWSVPAGFALIVLTLGGGISLVAVGLYWRIWRLILDQPRR